MTAPITPTESYPKLAAAIGLADVRLKREDLHPYGSHKGRSIPVVISHYAQNGDRRFAISSSGNAALAAALYIQEWNAGRSGPEQLELDIFIGNHIAKHKADKLKEHADEHIRVILKERPLQALAQAVSEGVRSLRQSTDDQALIRGIGCRAR
jgi:threonine dehydratase